MRGKWRRLCIKFLVALIVFLFCCLHGKIERNAMQTLEVKAPAFILDAGHGGEDGGAVSHNGIKESTINLNITLCLDQMLGLIGECPLLLREEDISLHESNAFTLREKKVSDLKNRVAAANKNPTATLISIHQNSYPEPKYRGSQVFFAPTSGSKELASKLQSKLKICLQPENNRLEKEISDNVYLMNHIENRAVLIECGFMSNPDEVQLLQKTDYQKKLALTIASVLVE